MSGFEYGKLDSKLDPIWRVFHPPFSFFQFIVSIGVSGGLAIAEIVLFIQAKATFKREVILTKWK